MLLVPILVLGAPNPSPADATTAAAAPKVDKEKTLKYLKKFSTLPFTNFDACKDKATCENQYISACASYVARGIHHEKDTPVDTYDIAEFTSLTREPPSLVNTYTTAITEIFKDPKCKETTDAIIKKTKDYCATINYAGKTISAQTLGLAIGKDGTVGEKGADKGKAGDGGAGGGGAAGGKAGKR